MVEDSPRDDRRQNIRFNPDNNALVIVQREEKIETDPRVGLLRDESHAGCAAVFHSQTFPFEDGDTVLVKPGNIQKMKASIVWISKIDERLVKAGFEYHNPGENT